MQLVVPEIVISDDVGIVERIPAQYREEESIDRMLSQWMVRELMSSNRELEEQLRTTKKKWYVAAAGCVTTVIPLVVCGFEIYFRSTECD